MTSRSSAVAPPLSRESFQVLKLLASRGGQRHPVLLTSKELGEALGASQQAASNYLVDLTRRGFLTRTIAGRKQALTLTAAGAQVLQGELAELRRVLEEPGPLPSRGTIVSGLGEGRYYLSLPGYVAQFQARLGYLPFPGTLNVKLAREDLPLLEQAKKLSGIRIDGFQDQGRTFGGATCYPSRLDGRFCHLILPDRTHYVDVAEFIAPVELRKVLRLKDTDPVRMEVGVAPPRATKGDP